MIVSLNELVSMVSDRVGQPFNVALQEELKIIINYKLADFFRKAVNNDASQRKYFQRGFVVQFKKLRDTDCPGLLSGCDVLISTKKVPEPLRTKERLFDFVGSKDSKTAYSYSTPEQIETLKYNRYTGKVTRYFYMNGYLYLLNNVIPREGFVRGLFLDPRSLKDFKCPDGTACYTDDDQFEAPDDLINSIITDIYRVELRQLVPEKEEVTIDEEEN